MVAVATITAHRVYWRHEHVRGGRRRRPANLTLCSDGHTDEAAALLAPGASIVFPGGVAYTGPADQVEHGRMLYRRVDKDIERVDVYRSADDARWCVIVNGTLNGEASDGSAFAGVRFIDRFGVRDGLIDEHHVWNDLAALGIVTSFAR